jgi:hypothetical protein
MQKREIKFRAYDNEKSYDIEIISEAKANLIISYPKNYPKKRYLLKEIDSFIAIDNTTLDAWTEEFTNEIDAIKWLNRES